MSYLSITAAVIFVIAVIQGLYILNLDPSSRTHRLFALMSLCLAVWLFGAMFAYISPNIDRVIFWFRLSSFGFIFLHAFTLHFCIELTGVQGVPRALVPAIYIPSLAFYYISLTGLIVYKDFIRLPEYWIAVPDYGSWSFLLLMLQYISYYLLSFFLLLAWRMRTKSRREKIQASILVLSLASTIFLFNLEPFILPLMSSYKSLAISPMLGIIWITGVWIAVGKYRLLSITHETVHDDIIHHISESIIMLDLDLRVITANTRTASLLGTQAAELRGRGIEEIVLEHHDIAGTLTALGRGELESLNRRLHYRGSPAEKTMMECRFTPIGDRFGDIIGILLIADEMRGVKQLKMRYRITDRESDVILYILDGFSNRDIAHEMGVAERTVKAHITNIYNKLDVNSKMKLFNLLKIYNLHPFDTEKPSHELPRQKRLLKLAH